LHEVEARIDIKLGDEVDHACGINDGGDKLEDWPWVGLEITL